MLVDCHLTVCKDLSLSNKFAILEEHVDIKVLIELYIAVLRVSGFSPEDRVLEVLSVVLVHCVSL